MKYVSIFLFAICASGIAGSPITDTIKDLSPNILELRTSVETALRESGALIGTTFANVTTLVQNARTGLDERVSELQKNVDESCVSKLGALDLNSVDLCSNSANVSGVININFVQLGKLRIRSLTAIPKCLKAVDGVGECILNEIQAIQNEINEIESAASKQVENVLATVQNCVDGRVKEIQSALENITNECQDNDNASS